SDTDQTFGPILIAAGHINSAAHHRMMTLLSNLTHSGASMRPEASGLTPSGYISLQKDTTASISFRADRVEHIASLTKVMTCLLARRFVELHEMDDMIEVVPSYTGSSSNAPTVNVGDTISWNDAFHATLMVSHNQLSDTLAYHAGVRLDPTADPNSTEPIDAFVSYMNDVAKNEWGWSEAQFNAPQGSSYLTSRHMSELMFKVEQND